MRIQFLLLALCIFISACKPSARFRSDNVSATETRLGSNESTSKSDELGRYIREWLNTPYQFGGTTKKGVDCSGFSSQVMLNIYNIEIPRTAEDQFNQGKKIRDGWLSPGDLVFFKNVRGRGIDHVGVFLGNGRFVHASTSAGVIVSDLEEDYYRKRYVGACRYQ